MGIHSPEVCHCEADIIQISDLKHILLNIASVKINVFHRSGSSMLRSYTEQRVNPESRSDPNLHPLVREFGKGSGHIKELCLEGLLLATDPSENLHL